VEDGQHQPDVTEVATAFLQSFAAGGAILRLGGSTESLVQRSICGLFPGLSKRAIEVVQVSVRDINDGLRDDVLRAQDSELQGLDALGVTVQHLLLAVVLKGGFHDGRMLSESAHGL
jgi:hypothetical protein